MINDIFASKTQAKLITLFVKNPQQEFYQREIVKLSGESLGSIQYELKRLERIGLLVSLKATRLKYYRLNREFFLFPEFRDIVFKVSQRGLE